MRVKSSTEIRAEAIRARNRSEMSIVDEHNIIQERNCWEERFSSTIIMDYPSAA